MILNVHLLPSLVAPESLAGSTVVVIDVLRATTTITTALAAGARDVIACLEVEEARGRAAELGESVLLGGEREGVPIAGFDLGNSPDDYSPERVAGKSIVFTTTNGTRAMLHCRQARQVLLGAFVNFAAVCHELARQIGRSETPSIDLLCAGTRNEVTREDVLLAGAIVDELRREFAGRLETNDQADIAADAWNSATAAIGSGRPLAEILRRSRGGRNMIELGQQRDIEIAAQIDRYDLVAALNVADWRIRLV